MVSLCLLLLVVVGALAQPEAKPGSCAPVKCASPYPCIGGSVVRTGCCLVCIKDKTISPVTECPPGICATVSCGGNLRECSGPNKYIKHGGGMCGCCSTCIYLVDVDGDCTKFDTECKKGSTCNPRTGRCEPNGSYCLRPKACQTVKCGVREGQCRGLNEYIKEGAGICGCCNACVTLIDKGDDCSERLKECKSGTQCNPVTKVCE